MSKSTLRRVVGLAVAAGVTVAGAVVALPSKGIVHGGDASAAHAGPIVQFGLNCTGSLIHPEWVLTAAHCFKTQPKTEDVTMRIGSVTSGVGGDVRRAVQVIRHPGHDGKDQVGPFDLALVKLNIPSYKPTVRLARPDESHLWDSDGRYGQAIGWGAMTNVCHPDMKAYGYPDTLQTGNIRLLGSFGGAIRFGGGSAVFTNAGDSGGPLLFGDGTIVAGVASWMHWDDADGGRCSGEGGYAEVGNAAVRAWIHSEIPDIDAPQSPWNDVDGYVYAIDEHDGDLRCFKHNGYISGAGFNENGTNDTPGSWDFGGDAGWGWHGFQHIFTTADKIYGLTESGTLRWYDHTGYETCADPDQGGWVGGTEIAQGLGPFRSVFGMSTNDYPNAGGVFYAITRDGKLLWFRHTCHEDGGAGEACLVGPREVGTGWGDFRHVFSGGNGVIYAINDAGELKWFRHNGYKTGAGLNMSGSWSGGGRVIDRGWWDPVVVSGGSNGVIYSIDSSSNLNWTRHLNPEAGVPAQFGGFTEKVRVGNGWHNTYRLLVREASFL